MIDLQSLANKYGVSLSPDGDGDLSHLPLTAYDKLGLKYGTTTPEELKKKYAATAQKEEAAPAAEKNPEGYGYGSAMLDNAVGSLKDAYKGAEFAAREDPVGAARQGAAAVADAVRSPTAMPFGGELLGDAVQFGAELGVDAGRLMLKQLGYTDKEIDTDPTLVEDATSYLKEKKARDKRVATEMEKHGHVGNLPIEMAGQAGNVLPLVGGIGVGALTRNPAAGIATARVLGAVPSAQAFGQDYLDRRFIRGEDPKTARKEAAVTAGIELVSEEILPGFKAVGSALGTIARRAFGEGASEMLSQEMQQAAELTRAMTATDDKDRRNYVEFFPRDDEGRVTFSSVAGDTAKAGELGALMGGGFSAPTARSEARQVRQTKELEDAHKLLDELAKSDLDFAAGVEAARPAKAKGKDVGESILNTSIDPDRFSAILPDNKTFESVGFAGVVPQVRTQIQARIQSEMDAAADKTAAALSSLQSDLRGIEENIAYMKQGQPTSDQTDGMVNPALAQQMAQVQIEQEQQRADQARQNLYGTAQSMEELEQSENLQRSGFNVQMNPQALPPNTETGGRVPTAEAASMAPVEVTPQESGTLPSRPNFSVTNTTMQPARAQPTARTQSATKANAQAEKLQAIADLQKALQSQQPKDTTYGYDYKAIRNEGPEIRQARERVFEGAKTVGEAVRRVKQALPKASPLHGLIADLEKITRLDDVGFVVDNAGRLEGKIGEYNAGTNIVSVRGTSHKDHGLTPEIILHEALHAAVSRQIDRGMDRASDPRIRNAFKSLEIARGRIARNLEKIAKDSGVHKDLLENASQDVHELVSYMFTSPEVRHAIRNLDKSLFRKIIEAIGHMIGFDSNKHADLLENLLEHGQAFITRAQEVDAENNGRRVPPEQRTFAAKAPEPKKDVDVVRTGIFRDERNAEVEGRSEIDSVMDKVTKLLSSRAGDTPGVREAKERAAQRINARLVGFIVPSRNRVQKQMAKAKITSEQIDLENLAPLQTKAPELYKELVEAKEHIKGMSLDIAKAISAHADLSQMTAEDINILTKIASSAQLGDYLTRTYKIDDTKGGKKYAQQLVEKAAKNPKGPEAQIINNARNYIAKQLLSFPANWKSLSKEELDNMYRIWNDSSPDGLSEEQIIANLEKKESANPNVNDMASHMVLALLNLEDTNSNLKNIFKRGEGLNTTIIQSRAHVPEAIRELWGEIKDPIYNLYNTAQKMNQFLSRQRMLNEEYERGFGKFFFKPEKMTPAERNRYTATIPDTKEWGPLAGLKTTPRYAQAMRAFVQMETAASDAVLANRPEDWLISKAPNVWKGFRYVARQVKYVGVVLNPANWVYNAAGAPLNMVMNGNVNPLSNGLLRSFKVMRDLVNQQNKKAVSQEDIDAWAAGVVDNSFAGEIKEAEWKALLEQIFKKEDHPLAKYLGPGGIKKLQDAKWLGNSIKAGITDVYAVMDLYAKVANFFHERDFLTAYYNRQGISKTKAQINFDAGERVKRTNLTYTRAIPLARALEGGGLTMFLTYTTETFRTAYNNFAVGLQDIVNGQRVGDAGLVAHGVKRVAGASAATAAHTLFLKGIGGGLAKLMGVAAGLFGDDDDEAKIKEAMGELYDNKELLEIFRGADGTRAFLDISRFDPNDLVNTILRAVASGNMDEAVQGASDFLIMNTLLGRLLEQTGMPNNNPSIKRTSRGLYEDAMNGITATGVSADFAGRLIRTTEPLIPTLAKTLYPNKEKGDLPEAVRALDTAGFKPVIYKPLDEVSRSYSTYAGVEKDVVADVRKELESGKPYGLRSLEDVYVNAIADEHKAFVEARKSIAGAEAAGVSKGKIMTQLRNDGADNKQLVALVSGKFQPHVFGPGSLASLEKEILRGKPLSERAAIRKQVMKLEADLGKLSNKYRKLTKED